MNIFVALSMVLFSLTWTSGALCSSITYYSDGALIEYEGLATKGVILVPLQDGMLENSLRIKPAAGTSIQRVEILPTTQGNEHGGKELEGLVEQRNRLNDRLQALATRETIFVAAAKSQSGKAPRKTKSNPDPMNSIRQGTDFAIAQLEAVYTARRKTEQEIKRLDAKIAAARKSGPISERRARITVSPLQGKVTATYAIATQTWQPFYNIFLNGTKTATVDLYGHLPEPLKGYRRQIARTTLSGTARDSILPVTYGSDALLARHSTAISDELFGNGAISSFSFALTNNAGIDLPPGEASIYKQGEFIGKVRFEGISSGRRTIIRAGM